MQRYKSNQFTFNATFCKMIRYLSQKLKKEIQFLS